MAYHVSNLPYGSGDRSNPADPAYYQDRDGFVPEQGDNAAEFTAHDGQPYDPEYVGPDGVTWQEWVTAAEQAKQRVDAGLT